MQITPAKRLLLTVQEETEYSESEIESGHPVTEVRIDEESLNEEKQRNLGLIEEIKKLHREREELTAELEESNNALKESELKRNQLEKELRGVNRASSTHVKSRKNNNTPGHNPLESLIKQHLKSLGKHLIVKREGKNQFLIADTRVFVEFSQGTLMCRVNGQLVPLVEHLFCIKLDSWSSQKAQKRPMTPKSTRDLLKPSIFTPFRERRRNK